MQEGQAHGHCYMGLGRLPSNVTPYCSRTLCIHLACSWRGAYLQLIFSVAWKEEEEGRGGGGGASKKVI